MTVVVDPELIDLSNDYNEVHINCKCSPDVGLCGTPLEGDQIPDEDYDVVETDCVVCQDLENLGCPRCEWL